MPPKTKVPLDKVRELYLQGKSGREIAEIIEMPKSTVLQQINNLGLSRPNMQRRNKTGNFCKDGNEDVRLPNPFLGKKHSLASRKKIASAHKGKWSGKNNPNYGVNARRFHRHPSFKTGIGCYRPMMLADFDAKCIICDSTDNIIVHHRDGNRENNVRSNLLVLCESCHHKIHAVLNPRKRDAKTGRFLKG